MGDCRAEVDAIVRSRKSRQRPQGAPGHEVSRTLARLPARCRPDIEFAARDSLAALPAANEGDFAAILNALALMNDPLVTDLAVSAIRSPHTMVKEDYVSVLEDVDQLDLAIQSLIAVLDNGIERPGRPDLTTTIRALHARQSREAVALIAKYVRHPDVQVRGAALTFLIQFDESGEAGSVAFIDQLRRESNADLLELLIDGLRQWRRRVDPSILKRLWDNESTPDSLRDSLRAAMSEGGSNESLP